MLCPFTNIIVQIADQTLNALFLHQTKTLWNAPIAGRPIRSVCCRSFLPPQAKETPLSGHPVGPLQEVFPEPNRDWPAANPVEPMKYES